MSMILKDPFHELVSLRDVMDRMFDERLIRPINWLALEHDGSATVPLDMYEEGNNLIVKASVPNIKSENLNVQIRNDVLTISGEVKKDEEHKERNYYLQEHRYNRFARSVTLPYPVLVDKAEAVFENGVMTLILPKTEEPTVKRIPVKAIGR